MARLIATGAALALGRALTSALREHPALTRTNFRGRTVSLAGGAGAAAATIVAAGLHKAPAGVLITCAAGGLGLVDDLTPDPSSYRGLRGHLKALKQGKITTGILKLAGLGASAAVASALIPRETNRVGRIADWALDTIILAGSANLINLLDLRPGRGAKAALALAAPTALGTGPGKGLARATSVIAVAQLPEDLGEQMMLGDTGANALGALAGYSICLSASRGSRALLAASLIGATLASEKVSFSAIIAKTPGLRQLDAWGRL